MPDHPDSSGHDPDGNGREETADERADRNWRDILQELRISQTGTQIIAGFLLTLAFQQRFQQLDAFQISLYLALVLIAALTTVVGLAPVSLHRTLFRHHEKQLTVKAGDRFLHTMLALISLLTAGVTELIFDVVASRLVGVAAAVVVLLALLLLLVVVPKTIRSRPAASLEQPSSRAAEGE